MKNKFFVIDSNNLVSAFLFEYSTPKLALDKVKRLGKISGSVETYTEFCDVFRPKIDRYIPLDTRLDILNEFREILLFHEIFEKITDCRDPKDNKFLELAISSNAS